MSNSPQQGPQHRQAPLGPPSPQNQQDLSGAGQKPLSDLVIDVTLGHEKEGPKDKNTQIDPDIMLIADKIKELSRLSDEQLLAVNQKIFLFLDGNNNQTKGNFRELKPGLIDISAMEGDIRHLKGAANFWLTTIPLTCTALSLVGLAGSVTSLIPFGAAAGFMTWVPGLAVAYLKAKTIPKSILGDTLSTQVGYLVSASDGQDKAQRLAALFNVAQAGHGYFYQQMDPTLPRRRDRVISDRSNDITAGRKEDPNDQLSLLHNIRFLGIQLFLSFSAHGPLSREEKAQLLSALTEEATPNELSEYTKEYKFDQLAIERIKPIIESASTRSLDYKKYSWALGGIAIAATFAGAASVLSGGFEAIWWMVKLAP